MRVAVRIMLAGALFVFLPGFSAADGPGITYASLEIAIPNQAAGVSLAGTLTIPKVEKKVPAVLLITGAGPQDRNETTAGHKTFQVLTELFTRLGIAVLRMDDRGTGHSTGKFENATTQDFAADAKVEYDFLKTRSEIDPARIGLLGHGEGATVAAMLAAKDPQIAFLLLLSAPAVPGQDVLLEQTARAEAAGGIPDEQVQADHAIGEQLYKLAGQGKSEADLKQVLAKFSKKVPPPVLENWQRQLPRFSSPWLRFFLTYNPASAYEQIACPVLAIYGENDLQVIAEQNAPELQKALKKAHNKEVTVIVIPQLNYLLQTSQTGLAWEYGKIQETIAPVALQAVAQWMIKVEKTSPL